MVAAFSDDGWGGDVVISLVISVIQDWPIRNVIQINAPARNRSTSTIQTNTNIAIIII